MEICLRQYVQWEILEMNLTLKTITSNSLILLT